MIPVSSVIRTQMIQPQLGQPLGPALIGADVRRGVSSITVWASSR